MVDGPGDCGTAIECLAEKKTVHWDRWGEMIHSSPVEIASHSTNTDEPLVRRQSARSIPDDAAALFSVNAVVVEVEEP